MSPRALPSPHPHRAARVAALTLSAAALSFSLTGCGSGASDSAATTGVTTAASAAEPSASASASPSASDPAAGAASSASQAAPAKEVAVAPKGVSSPECMTMSTVLMNATTVGMKANSGKVEQADVDRAFGADAVAGLPSDALVYVEATKAVATPLVGKDAAGANALLGAWQGPFADLTAATQKLCS